MRGGYSSYGQSEGDRGQFDARDNGAVEGMPKSLSNCDSSKTNRAPSYDAVADDRLERLSIAESEGSDRGDGKAVHGGYNERWCGGED